MKFSSKILISLLVLNPTAAFAAGLGKPAAIWWPIINFSLYFFLMSFVYRKKIRPVLIARREKVLIDLQAAGREIAEAEEELSLTQDRYSNLVEEKNELNKKYELEIERLTEEIVKNASREAEQIAADVERQVASQLAAAKREIRNKLVRQASAKAKLVLEQSLNEDKDQVLRTKALEQFVA